MKSDEIEQDLKKNKGAHDAQKKDIAKNAFRRQLVCGKSFAGR